MLSAQSSRWLGRDTYRMQLTDHGACTEILPLPRDGELRKSYSCLFYLGINGSDDLRPIAGYLSSSQRRCRWLIMLSNEPSRVRSDGVRQRRWTSWLRSSERFEFPAT